MHCHWAEKWSEKTTTESYVLNAFNSVTKFQKNKSSSSKEGDRRVLSSRCNPCIGWGNKRPPREWCACQVRWTKTVVLNQRCLQTRDRGENRLPHAYYNTCTLGDTPITLSFPTPINPTIFLDCFYSSFFHIHVHASIWGHLCLHKDSFSRFWLSHLTVVTQGWIAHWHATRLLRTTLTNSRGHFGKTEPIHHWGRVF